VGVPGHPLSGLRFEFALPAFDDPEANRFQVCLEGHDKQWSPWSAEAYKEYTDLPEGRYLFRVRARNVHGRRAAEGTWRFTIRPPWYRTIWCRVLGVLLLLGAGALLRPAFLAARRALGALLQWRRTHLVGPYRLLDILGQGGMGTVYRALDRRNGSVVALKILHEDLRGEDLLLRFTRECAICEGLRHPNMVRILEHGEASGRLYVAMERYEGPTLREIMATAPPDVPTACRVAGALFRVIHDIHGLGVIHRDIKPENILFRSRALDPRTLEQDLVFLDFGLARMMDSAQHTRTGLLTGTVDYLSPEYLRGEGLAEASLDFYAIGIVFYELLTGRTPHAREGEDMMQRVYAIVYGEVRSPGELVPGLPEAVSALAMSLIEKERSARLTDCTRILAAFAALGA
jgi:serine/threonine protein kinase